MTSEREELGQLRRDIRWAQQELKVLGEAVTWLAGCTEEVTFWRRTTT